VGSTVFTGTSGPERWAAGRRRPGKDRL